MCVYCCSWGVCRRCYLACRLRCSTPGSPQQPRQRPLLPYLPTVEHKQMEPSMGMPHSHKHSSHSKFETPPPRVSTQAPVVIVTSKGLLYLNCKVGWPICSYPYLTSGTDHVSTPYLTNGTKHDGMFSQLPTLQVGQTMSQLPTLQVGQTMSQLTTLQMGPTMMVCSPNSLPYKWDRPWWYVVPIPYLSGTNHDGMLS